MLIPVILVPLLFIGVFLSCYAINFLYRQAETQAVSDNLRAKSVLLDATLNFYTISEELFSDEELKQLLTTDFTDSGEAATACSSYGRLATLLANNTAISSILIYTDNPTIPDSRYFRQADTRVTEEWFPALPSAAAWHGKPGA